MEINGFDTTKMVAGEPPFDINMEQSEELEFWRLSAEKEAVILQRCREDNMALRDSLSKLAMYFTSGNSVPVERATILAKDFWRITRMTPNAR